MGWDKGKYYTRSRRVSGRVVREYFGTGPVAELMAARDAEARIKRANDRFAANAERDRLAELDRHVDELSRLTDLIAEAALLAAGFRQHHRGDWRKRRDSIRAPCHRSG